MAKFVDPPKGRLIVSILYASVDAVAEALGMLERRFGRVEHETAGRRANCREQYYEEMGRPLHIRFFSFERPVGRETLPEIKALCRKIESKYSDRVNDFMFRTVNIDPGILTTENLVMAAGHDRRHRIYLRDGVYAETALIHSKGQFTRLPWTAEDYCHEDAIDLFERTRQVFELVAVN